MGYEGLDGSRDVANEEKKHPWEVFPEDDSASSKDGEKKKHKKTPEQREKEKARRDKRKARLDTFKAWVSKNKILAVGIALAIIALIVGVVFLIRALTSPKEEPAPELIEVESLRIPENFVVEETVTPDYAYTIIRMKLLEATKDTHLESGKRDIAKFEDVIDEYIRNNVKNETDKLAYELVKIILINNAGDSARADYLFETFDGQNYTLGQNTRYIYITAKIVYYATAGNIQEEAKWRDLLQKEYLNNQTYLDMDSYEATEDGYKGTYVSNENKPVEEDGEEEEEEEE